MLFLLEKFELTHPGRMKASARAAADYAQQLKLKDFSLLSDAIGTVIEVLVCGVHQQMAFL